MAYIDYDYYANTFGSSTIPETSFSSYERLARVSLDNFTFNRLKNDNTLITDDVKECLCVMMEKAYNYQQEDENSKIIASESVDGHSVAYFIPDIQGNEVDQSRITKVKLYNMAEDYLWDTGLLYRGIDHKCP